MSDLNFWNDAIINKNIYYDRGTKLSLRRLDHGVVYYDEVKVIDTYPRFVLVEGIGGVRFAVLKKDLFFKEVVEW